MKHTWIRIIAFFAILTAVLVYCANVLMLKDDDGIYSMKKFYDQEEDTVDVLILGSSHAYTGFNTGLLWDRYGMSAYILGGSVQPYWNSYYNLKEALKTQHPKLIILEGVQAKYYSDYNTKGYIEKNNYGLKLSRNKVDSLMASIPCDEIRDYLPEFVVYHSRYTILSREDFLKDKGDPTKKDWKGYSYLTITDPQETTDVSDVTDIGYMSKKNEDYFNRMVDLANENNIPIEVVIAPYAEIYDGEQVVFNQLAQLCEERGVPYTNCNLLLDEIGIDYKTDSADAEHLNWRGSGKLTEYIGDNISAKYDIPDHRGDERFASWQRNADDIRTQLSKNKENDQ